MRLFVPVIVGVMIVFVNIGFSIVVVHLRNEVSHVQFAGSIVHLLRVVEWNRCEGVEIVGVNWFFRDHCIPLFLFDLSGLSCVIRGSDKVVHTNHAGQNKEAHCVVKSSDDTQGVLSHIYYIIINRSKFNHNLIIFSPSLH
jgi:hypothetical protein